MSTRNKKRVVWKVPANGHAPERAKRPRYYQADIALDLHRAENYASSLVPGSLWQVAADSVMQTFIDFDEEQPPYPYLQGSTWAAPPGVLHHLYQYSGTTGFIRGEFAIYIGTTRVAEMSRSKLITVPRHTFLLNGAMFLTKNLNDWSPIV